MLITIPVCSCKGLFSVTGTGQSKLIGWLSERFKTAKEAEKFNVTVMNKPSASTVGLPRASPGYICDSTQTDNDPFTIYYLCGKLWQL